MHPIGVRDLLNLEADQALYGKETAGDLWEGKRTVMLLHFLRTVRKSACDRTIRFLRQARHLKRSEDVAWLHQAMVEAGSLQHGRALAVQYSERAIERHDRGIPFLRMGDDWRFLREMLRYVIDRIK